MKDNRNKPKWRRKKEKKQNRKSKWGNWEKSTSKHIKEHEEDKKGTLRRNGEVKNENTTNIYS